MSAHRDPMTVSLFDYRRTAHVDVSQFSREVMAIVRVCIMGLLWTLVLIASFVGCTPRYVEPPHPAFDALVKYCDEVSAQRHMETLAQTPPHIDGAEFVRCMERKQP